MRDQLTLSHLRVRGTLDAAPTTARHAERIPLPVSVPLDIDVELQLDLEDAGRSDDLSHSIDLGMVAELIEMIASHGHWGTLESLGLTIVRTLLLPPAPGEARTRAEAATLRVRRPSGLGSHATPGISFHRLRSWCTTERRVIGPGVAADIIAETRTTEVLRVRMTAGSEWVLPADAYTAVIANVALDGRTASTAEQPGALLLVRCR